jgi:hypothetical protein
LLGPLQIGDTWHLIRIEDIRERGAPSLESLRPRIIEWLRFQEISQLQDRLAADARIERLREPDASMAPEGEVTVPDDADEAPAETIPEVETPRPGQPAAPPFPFPMGPGGVSGGAHQSQAAAAQAAPAPRPPAEQTPGPAPVQLVPPPAPQQDPPAQDLPVQ